MIDERLKAKCSVADNDSNAMICTPNNVLMPKIDANTNGMNEYYYIENFYYTAKVLGLLDVHGMEFLKKLKKKGQEYCSLNIDKATKQYPEASEDEIQKTCFCAAWLLAILNRGFGLGNFSNFFVIHEIQKTCFCAAWLQAILNRGFGL